MIENSFVIDAPPPRFGDAPWEKIRSIILDSQYPCFPPGKYNPTLIQTCSLHHCRFLVNTLKGGLSCSQEDYAKCPELMPHEKAILGAQP
jgi:hypothetical protein